MMLKRLRFALNLFGVLMGVLFAGYIAGKHLLTVNYAQGPLASQFPTMALQDGYFVNHDHSMAMKLLFMQVRLSPSTDYVISFKVREVKGEDPVLLNIDFFGDGYNSDAQKIRVPLSPGTKDKVVSEVIHSGEAVPKQASLRIYFSEASQVSLGEVRVLGTRINLRRGFIYGVLGCLLIITGLAWVIGNRDPESFTCIKNLNMLQRIEFGFVVAFCGVIVAPIFQNEFKAFYYRPLEENRRLLEKPEGNMFRRLFSEGAAYSKAYEKYYNDNYAFRSLLIRAKNQLDYSIFNHSDEVIIGKQGWMEYRNVLAEQEIRAERLTAKDWELIYGNFKQLQTSLAKRKITLVLMPVPMKFSVYPEYSNENVIRRAAGTAFECLLNYFDKHSELMYIDVRKALLIGKRKHFVFYRTDFHWNSIGAFYAAEETVNRLAYLSGMPISWNHPLEYHKEAGFFGGLNQALAVLFPPEEDKIVIKPTWPENGEYLPPEYPYEIHFRADPAKASNILPSTLLIGNSFSQSFIQTGFYQYFSEIRFFPSRRFNRLRDFIPSGTRYVIFQFLESDLGSYLLDSGYWPSWPGTGDGLNF